MVNKGSPFEIAMQHLSLPPPPLRKHMPDLSPAIEEVVLRALAKEAGQRFASVQDFAVALHRVSGASGGASAVVPVSSTSAAADAAVLHVHLLGDFRLISGETPVTNVDVPAYNFCWPISPYTIQRL